MKIKILIIFLLVNLFLAVFVMVDFYVIKNKKKQDVIVKEVVRPAVLEQNKLLEKERRLEQSVQLEQNKMTVVNQEKVDEGKCVIWQTFNEEQNKTMEMIVKKIRNQDYVGLSISKDFFYSVFWDLGKNKENAEAAFLKQKGKGGAMQDEKYKLILDDKNWIVKVAKIKDSQKVAENLASEIGEKAKKANAGGSWKVKEEATWLYKFSNFERLDAEIISSVELLVSPSRDSCVIN